jgi:CHAT domain-containing protein/Tfp pilus assembly protein PilF
MGVISSDFRHVSLRLFLLRRASLVLMSTLLWIPGMADIALAEPVMMEAKQNEQPETVLLEAQGDLSPGDSTLDDGSFYDLHTFQGQAGQAITITLESPDFDTYLILINDQGEAIAQNDDISSSNYNSSLTLILPGDGGYGVVANSYAAGSTGRYTLTVTEVNAAAAQTEAASVTAGQLFQQALQAYRAGRYQDALQLGQESLQGYQAVGDVIGEANARLIIGTVHRQVGDYPLAVEQFQTALTLLLELEAAQGDSAELRRSEAALLANLGATHRVMGNYADALAVYDQVLEIYRRPPETEQDRFWQRQGEGVVLDNIGVVYVSMGQVSLALDYHQQARDIFLELDDLSEAGIAINNIANAYEQLGRYPESLENYQQALDIDRETNDQWGIATILDNMAVVYSRLGLYDQALANRQEALDIFQALGDRNDMAITLSNIGVIYDNLGQYDLALETYEQALALNREMGDPDGISVTLGNLGMTYLSLREYDRALEYLQESLTVAREIRSLSREGATLNSLGLVYLRQNRYPEAIESFQQALAISRETGDRFQESYILGNLAYTVAEIDQPELAITLYKESVNITEAIRSELQVLSTEEQESFTDQVAGTYRRLADLLLQQDRMLEAQQVLDLLKVQELEDYLQDVRGNEATAQGLDYWPAEQTLVDLHDQAIAQWQEYFRLQATPTGELTVADQQRLTDLERQLISFQQFIEIPPVQTELEQLRRTAKGQNLNLEHLYDLQTSLRSLPQSTVLLYPLVLEDRLELVLVRPEGEPLRRTVAVSRPDLNRAIAQLLSEITDPRRFNTTTAEQLYDWLIRPLEADLAALGTETIIYAADGQLRYLPLAALHDGEQWLAQRFAINYITAATLTDFTTSEGRDLRILAGAFTEGNYQFSVGNRQFQFAGLPFAGREVENIASMIPNTETIINRDFNLLNLTTQANEYTILHLATHAEFVPGVPEQSFVLLGNGDRITLRDIPSLDWADVDLVVLSACKTAVGSELGNGEEILGFGYQVQRTDARAAIASLWYVNDESGQVLMTAFYVGLSQGLSPADAMRQAQTTMITGNFAALGMNDIDTTTRTFDHPYYWAPFILIGNGL